MCCLIILVHGTSCDSNKDCAGDLNAFCDTDDTCQCKQGYKYSSNLFQCVDDASGAASLYPGGTASPDDAIKCINKTKRSVAMSVLFDVSGKGEAY